MIGEREDFNSSTQYGALKMRSYNIDGNAIDAFYDSSEKLVFVMDNTINERKPNVLLVINPAGDKKWDEILSGDYGVDLETIRPKVDNKYQKFDIEYSGLSVYDTLIHSFDAGDSLEDALNQLTILRDSAARHSAMTRLNVANEIITKTNATIVKTRESIVRLNARLKTLRAKVAEAKKSIGREPTKQSASKILKLEAQIDATNEKIKRANERLKSAQKRLETATVDAELAEQFLNQPSGETKQTSKKVKPVTVAVEKRVVPVVTQEPDEEIEETVTTDEEDVEEIDGADDFEEYTEESTVEEETEDTEKIKPLFNEDPQILNNDIAFKPISFDGAANSGNSESETNVPDLSKEMLLTEETDETTEETKEIEDFSDKEPEPVPIETEEPNEPAKIEETTDEEKPMLDSMLPVPTDSESTADTEPMTDTESETETQSYDVPEFTSFIEPVEDVPAVKEESSLPEKLDEDMRQSEPVYYPETTDATENKMEEPAMPAAPVAPVPPIMPQSVSNISYDEPVAKRKPSILYYLLLVLLIVLAIFTLWLYQRSVDPTRPVVAQNIERVETDNKNSVLKKQPGARKPFKIKIEDKKKEEKPMPVFLDEKPVVEPDTEEAEVVVEKKPKIKEVIEEEVVVETVKTEPEIIDAVPARVNSSGKSDNATKKISSEEEILAAKPAFQPGSKYDEMFIAGEDAVMDDSVIEYPEMDPQQYMQDADEEMLEYEYTVSDDIQDPLYDAEEMEYQAEYNAGMFEE